MMFLVETPRWAMCRHVRGDILAFQEQFSFDKPGE